MSKLAFWPFLLALGTLAMAAHAASLDVKIEGVKGAEKVNVEGLLAIKRYSEGKEIAESRVHRLHEDAPGEIARALESFGYYRVVVDGKLEQDKDEYKATYRIAPGEPVVLDSVDVRIEGPGAADSVLQNLVVNFPLEPGAPLQHASWELGKGSIAGRGHVRGYLDGKFSVHEVVVDSTRTRAKLRLVYDTGPRYLYGPVRFEQDVLEQRFLDGYVKFKEGEPIDFDELRGFQNSLRGTNYFGRIEVEQNRDQADGLELPIDVKLEGSPPLRLEFGASYGTDEGFGGTAGAVVRRVNRRGHRADLQLKVAQTNQSATANYRIPWASPPTSMLSFSAGFEREETDARLNRTFLLSSAFSHLRGPWQETLALEYRDETYEVGPDEGRTQLFGPNLQWSLVKADDRVFTRRGYRLRTGVMGSWDNVFASATYVQANFDFKAIRGGKSPHRLIGKVKGGHTWTEEFHELPASIRYYAGGASSVRGYGYEELTPRDPLGQPIGGSSLIETGLEYDYRFHRSWAVAAFYDLGGALENTSDRLSSGAGVGVRWLSPVGMIRLDYAWGLSLPGRPDQIHFMIGPDL